MQPALKSVAVEAELCPWCESPITHAKFTEIQAKIRGEEAQRLKAAESELRKRLAEERAALEAAARAEREALEAQASKDREALTLATANLEKAKLAQAEIQRTNKEALDRTTAELAALERSVGQRVESAVALRVKERDEQHQQAAAALRVKHEEDLRQSRESLKAEHEKATLKDQETLKRALASLEQAKTAREELERDHKEAIEKAKADLAAVEKNTREEIEKTVTKRMKVRDEQHAQEAAKLKQQHDADLRQSRELLKAEYDKAALKQLSDANREKEAYLKKIQELQRKVEAKTSNALGDGAEIDVFEEIKGTFERRGDKVKRVPKGHPGPDVIHEVMNKGAACGKIVIDSKNRQSWQNAYTKKLHEDMLAAKADYAILATTVFPRGQRELCIRDNVIVVCPARVLDVVRILRQGLVRIHQQNLSNEQRAEKKNKLYDYVSSVQYRQKFDEANKLTQDLLDIEAKETEAHRKVWENRGITLKKVQRVLANVDDEITAIIEEQP